MDCSMLPYGYKFRPTDQDLIKHLQHKAAGNPLPSLGFIEEYDLYSTEPDGLFRGSNEDVRYFFVKPKKNVKGGSRFRRRVGTNATWKGSNKGSPVHNLRGMVVGRKKNFVYTLNGGKNGKGVHGGYIMDEFSLEDSIPNVGGYVLCRVKKRPQHKNDQDQDHDDNTSDFSMISDVVNHDEEAMPTADQDQDQDVDDLIDIDELLSPLDDQERSKQLHEDHHQISPPVVINIEDDCDYDNAAAMINIDQNGHGSSFATEELVPCMSSGGRDINQDHSGPLILTVEADYHKQLPEVVTDPMQSVGNQPLVEKAYTTPRLLSAFSNAKTIPESLRMIEEFLLGDYD